MHGARARARAFISFEGKSGPQAATIRYAPSKSTAKKATTLFLTPTLMARVSRKLPGANVSNFLESCLGIVFFEFSAGQKNQKASKETVQTSRF